MTLTQRTLNFYRRLGRAVYPTNRLGASAAICPEYVKAFADAVVLKPNGHITPLVITDMATFAQREEQIHASRLANLWLRSGGAIELVGWRKDPLGWTVKRKEITCAQ